MTWLTEVTESTRVLINDIDSPQTYTDARIQRVAVIGANQVLQDVDFSTSYVYDLPTSGLVPDPSDLNPKDYTFINLTSLKTACLIIGGELKKYSLIGGVSVKDGPSSIDTGNLFKNLLLLSKQLCADYEAEKVSYQSGYNGENAGMVTTPFTQSSLEPNNIGGNYNQYDGRNII